MHEIITIVPELITLFLPGFIFMQLYYNFINKIRLEEFKVLYWSIFISFFIKTFWSCFHLFILNNSPVSESMKTAIYILTGFALPFVINWLQGTKWIQRFFTTHLHRTTYESVWRDVVDYEKGNMVRINIKNTSTYYIGQLIVKENNGNESWIVLKDYIICEENYESKSSESSYNRVVVLNLKDIESVEIFYEPDSKVWGNFKDNTAN